MRILVDFEQNVLRMMMSVRPVMRNPMQFDQCVQIGARVAVALLMRILVHFCEFWPRARVHRHQNVLLWVAFPGSVEMGS